MYTTDVYEVQTKKLRKEVKFLRALLEQHGIDEDEVEDSRARIDLGDGMKIAHCHALNDLG